MESKSLNTAAITAIVLAGGRGERFSKRDKGWIDYRGKAFIEHVVGRLQTQVDDIIISCNRNIERYRQLGYRVCTDGNDHFEGPLAGIYAGLALTESDTALIVPCDAPLLPTDLAARLAEAMNKTAVDICYCHDGLRDQYLFALLRTTLRASLGDYLTAGNRSVKAWYAQQRILVVDFADTAPGFANINSPADLNRILHQFTG